jgi:hypothetical protein
MKGGYIMKYKKLLQDFKITYEILNSKGDVRNEFQASRRSLLQSRFI